MAIAAQQLAHIKRHRSVVSSYRSLVVSQRDADA